MQGRQHVGQNHEPIKISKQGRHQIAPDSIHIGAEARLHQICERAASRQRKELRPGRGRARGWHQEASWLQKSQSSLITQAAQDVGVQPVPGQCQCLVCLYSSRQTANEAQKRVAMAAFLGFVRGLPTGVEADEALTLTGHRLYTDVLHRLRDEAGLAFLQPGRFLMPPPGPPPPWAQFFPLPGRSPLANLMGARFGAYVDAVRRDLMAPLFGDLDGLVVLADVLSALHQGQSAFADAQLALAAAADALRWGRSWTDWVAAFARLEMPPRSIARVAFAATKADHIATRQRGNLTSLMRRVTRIPDGGATSAVFAVASVRCTEDVVETLAGRPVSAVRGRIIGEPRPARFYPGEVPDGLPDDTFWQHRFLALPDFEPMHLLEAGRGGIPQLGLDALIAFLLADIL